MKKTKVRWAKREGSPEKKKAGIRTQPKTPGRLNGRIMKWLRTRSGKEAGAVCADGSR